MLKMDLCGKWSFHEVGSDKWLQGDVPGCNYTDLMANGKIPDAFVGMNEQEVQWVAEKDWEYIREFNLTAEMLKKNQIILNCEMLDTLAEIYINNTLVGKSENCHLMFKVNIKDYITKLTNKIRIKFLSPVAYIEKLQEEDAMPHSNNGITGVPHIRKPQSHLGWDWGPTLPLSGIVRPIYIEGYDSVKLDDFATSQKHADGKVEVIVDVATAGVSEDDCLIYVSITAPNKQIIHQKSALNKENKFKFEIENPELWWTNDISENEEQPLYKVEVELIKNEKVVDKLSKRIGLRTIVLNRSNDEFGKNFQFILNGVAIFAKGANWIPSDSFINRFTKEKADYFTTAVVNSNMNMLRVWGGGYYESDAFYDLCDEKGILVWQDFAFACAPYPFYNNKFLDSVKAEVECNVKRLRNHASLCLWCGNNEIEMMTLGWANKRKLVKWTKIFFHEILPAEVVKFDGITPFVVGSPSATGFMKKVNSDSDGDTHLWHVWHGLQPLTYYRKRFSRFCSEFGLESLPDIKTIQGFAKEADYSLKSPVFMAHQKCASGNSKMLYYVSTRFRIPKQFEDTIYFTQLIQNECVKDATEHWRRNRNRCNGSLYWQLNDCWPVTSWSSIDYEGRFKALQYGARHFNAPIMVSLEDKKSKVKVFAINDYPQPFKGKIVCALEDFDGNLIKKDQFIVDVKGVSSYKIAEIDYKESLKSGKENKVMVAEMFDEDDCLISRKTLLFLPEKKMKMPDPKLTQSVEVIKGVAYVTIKAEKFARFVKVDLRGSYQPFSDNYFDMLAGEETTISIPIGDRIKEDVEEAISVQSVALVKPKGSKTSDFFVRVKVALTPINIANFFYYHFT